MALPLNLDLGEPWVLVLAWRTWDGAGGEPGLFLRLGPQLLLWSRSPSLPGKRVIQAW